MYNTRIAVMVLTLGMLVCLGGSTGAADKESKPLFDGKTLAGWVQKNGTATYRVENGTIVGKTSEGSPNSFLCTTKPYGDFELSFDVKCDPRLNSGVQSRSKEKDNAEKRVNGPQVEIASSAAGGLGGYVYGEATGRGWLSPEDHRKPHTAFKDDGWNHYRVVARGPRIQTWINGEPIEDFTDEQAFTTHGEGFIGLQVHGIGRGTGPYEVAWRNLQLKPL